MSRIIKSILLFIALLFAPAAFAQYPVNFEQLCSTPTAPATSIQPNASDTGSDSRNGKLVANTCFDNDGNLVISTNVIGVGSPAGQSFNVLSYGGAGNTYPYYNLTSTNGTKQISGFITTAFIKVGMTIDCVNGSGVPIAPLNSVASITNTTTIQMTNNAVAGNVGSTQCLIGTIDDAGIAAAVAAEAASAQPANSCIYFPPGNYLVYHPVWTSATNFGYICSGPAVRIFAPQDFNYTGTNIGQVFNQATFLGGPIAIDGFNGSPTAPGGPLVSTSAGTGPVNTAFLEVSNWTPVSGAACLFTSADFGMVGFAFHSVGCLVAWQSAAGGTSLFSPFIQCVVVAVQCIFEDDNGNSIVGGVIQGASIITSQGSNDYFHLDGVTIVTQSATNPAETAQSGSQTTITGGSIGPCRGALCTGAVNNTSGLVINAGATVWLGGAVNLSSMGTGVALTNNGTCYITDSIVFQGTGTHFAGTPCVATLTHSANTFFIPGTIAAINFGNQNPDQTIIVTQVQAIDTNGATTCATAPVITFTNGTVTFTLTLTTGKSAWNWPSVDTSTGLPAIFPLGTTFTASTTAGTCATPPQNIEVTYTWQSYFSP